LSATGGGRIVAARTQKKTDKKSRRERKRKEPQNKKRERGKTSKRNPRGGKTAFSGQGEVLNDLQRRGGRGIWEKAK